jgi:hypothetical protein
MTSRFVSNLLVLLAGALLTCASLGMSIEAAGWIGLGVGAITALSTLVAFAVRGRGLLQRLLDGVLVLLGAWTVVASRAFAGDGSLKWLMFSAGVALLALAVQGLIAHEVMLELALGRGVRSELGLARVTPVDERSSSIRVAG